MILAELLHESQLGKSPKPLPVLTHTCAAWLPGLCGGRTSLRRSSHTTGAFSCSAEATGLSIPAKGRGDLP